MPPGTARTCARRTRRSRSSASTCRPPRLPDGAERQGQAVSGELLDRLPCGVVSFDDRGTIVVANAPLAAMLGYGRDELVGRPVETLLTVAGRIFFQTHLFPLVRLHGRAEELFVLFRRKDGSDLGTLLNAARH